MGNKDVKLSKEQEEYLAARVKYETSKQVEKSLKNSDIFVVSGRAIINHLAEHGRITAEEVESYVKTRARNKLQEIKLSVNGRMNRHQREFSKLLLKHLDETNEHLCTIEENINYELNKYKRQIEQLDGIPGIDITAAAAIIAEIGTDMSNFKTAEQMCSWVRLSSGNNESTGKKSPL